MTDSVQDSQLLVEDVVNALTGTTGQALDCEGLRIQMEHAAAEFDRRTADAFGKALLDSLTEDPGNLRQLEALLILGLAHPDVLSRNRISLAVEGRRLAVLLERSGDVERAKSVLEMLANRHPEERTIDHELAGILRRSGDTDELVERYMRRAQAAVSDGKAGEAIPWLQEILLLDRTRRDVARMIRDLRYQDAERTARGRRRNRLLVVLVLLSAGATAVAGRELKIERRYEQILPVVPSDPSTMYARRDALDAMLAEHRIFLRFTQVTDERDALRDSISEHERAKIDQQKRLAAAAQELLDTVEAVRLRGLRQSEMGNFDAALSSFEEALEQAPEGWAHTRQVQADVDALRRWKEESHK